MDAAAGRSEYADARFVRTQSERLATRNGEVDQASFEDSEGIGVRVRVGGAWGFAAVRGTGKADAGLEVEEVAAVYFKLGERLELHWLRDRIVALPRDDRWRALARAALRDDLYSLHRGLTAEVLRDTDSKTSAAERVDGWVARNPASERCLQTLAEIRLGHVFDTTTLPVAVREVRNLLLASGRS